MATKTWQVNTLERELADNYVYKVIYRVNGVDGDITYRATGEVELPKPGTLIPYADLTESQVLTWTKEKLNANNAGAVAAIEQEVENGVNAQKTPTTETGKPWS